MVVLITIFDVQILLSQMEQLEDKQVVERQANLWNISLYVLNTNVFNKPLIG